MSLRRCRSHGVVALLWVAVFEYPCRVRVSETVNNKFICSFSSKKTPTSHVGPCNQLQVCNTHPGGRRHCAWSAACPHGLRLQRKSADSLHLSWSVHVRSNRRAHTRWLRSKIWIRADEYAPSLRISKIAYGKSTDPVRPAENQLSVVRSLSSVLFMNTSRSSVAQIPPAPLLWRPMNLLRFEHTPTMGLIFWWSCNHWQATATSTTLFPFVACEVCFCSFGKFACCIGIEASSTLGSCLRSTLLVMMFSASSARLSTTAASPYEAHRTFPAALTCNVPAVSSPNPSELAFCLIANGSGSSRTSSPTAPPLS